VANYPFAPSPAAASGSILGTGADGAVTLDGSTSYAGSFGTPAGNVYTQLRDVQCSTLIINAGVTLKPTNYRIFCTGSVINNGTISAAGNNAAGQVAGASLLSNSTTGGRAGGAGGTGVSGPGAAGSNAVYGAPGGAGGAGTSGTAGAGGTVTVTTANAQANLLTLPFAAILGVAAYISGNQTLGFGAGGGGGGSDASSNAGGGGGSGGGIVPIFAAALVNNGTITVAGGNGAAGVAGNAGGGGSGSGGAILVYTVTPVTGTGTTNIAAGTIGAGSGTGAAGNPGGAGLLITSVV
jgi:hypothetical protein